MRPDFARPGFQHETDPAPASASWPFVPRDWRARGTSAAPRQPTARAAKASHTSACKRAGPGCNSIGIGLPKYPRDLCLRPVQRRSFDAPQVRSSFFPVATMSGGKTEDEIAFVLRRKVREGEIGGQRMRVKA